MCSEEEFGKELKLLQRVIETGRKVGADQDFWAKLSAEEDLFAEVVRQVRQWPVGIGGTGWLSFSYHFAYADGVTHPFYLAFLHAGVRHGELDRLLERHSYELADAEAGKFFMDHCLKDLYCESFSIVTRGGADHYTVWDCCGETRSVCVMGDMTWEGNYRFLVVPRSSKEQEVEKSKRQPWSRPKLVEEEAVPQPTIHRRLRNKRRIGKGPRFPTVTVDRRLTPAEAVAAAQLDWFNPETFERYPLFEDAVEEIHFFLCPRSKDGTVEELMAAIIEMTVDHPQYQPATVLELLALAAQHPEFQKEFPIMTLASTGAPSGCLEVIYLYEQDGERRMDLQVLGPERVIAENVRFAFVRK